MSELPFIDSVAATLGVLSLAALLILFKPLIGGLVHALWLALHPHLSKEERAARRMMRDQLMMQRMINSCEGPGLAAELTAIAARG
ncbi:MAG: hypothetical protein V4582_09705 [Pseudomonadota bacterium]